jgi:hypothetical protein
MAVTAQQLYVEPLTGLRRTRKKHNCTDNYRQENDRESDHKTIVVFRHQGCKAQNHGTVRDLEV